MWRDRVLIHFFDIDWTAPRLMFALSFAGLLWTGLLMTYILRRAGKGRALTDEELSTLGRSADPNQVRMRWVGAKGGRVEANASIDTLRRAAKRGDWCFFWAWPCMLVSGGVSAGLFFFGLFASARDTPTVIYVTVAMSVLPFLTIPPFMAWAALHTDIDLDVDEPDEL